MAKDYGIGYRRPPKTGQFAKGRSGNPRGRPKGSKNLATELAEELAETISIKENGKAKNVSKQRAVIKAVTSKAMQGNTQAANTLISTSIKLQDGSARTVEEQLSAEDEDILKEFAERLNTRRNLNARRKS